MDKSQKGSDHACSLLPTEFKQMVTDIRTVEQALGDGQKRFAPCEKPCHDKLSKSLVAARNLLEGHILTKKDINAKVAHPNGIPANRLATLIGGRLKKCINFDELILQTDLEL